MLVGGTIYQRLMVVMMAIGLVGYLLPSISQGNNRSSKGEHIVDAINQGKITQLVEQSEEELRQVNRLIRQFNQQDEYNQAGQLIKRYYPNGTQEIYQYHQQDQLVTVRVITQQQQFIEERTYVQGRLVSILQSDGQLLTIHYNQPSNPREAKLISCQLIVYDNRQIRLFNYNQTGQLEEAFYHTGQAIPQEQLSAFAMVSHVINPEKFRLGVTD